VFRNLESQMTEQSNKPIVSPDAAPEESQNSGGRENRAKVRYAFAAEAEVRDLRSKASVKGRCSDVSLDGCYVDTLAPFATGSIVHIRLEHDMREFQAVGAVVYAHASMGMGLKFTEVDPAHREVLRHWIANLSGEVAPGAAEINSKIATEVEAESQDMESNLKLVLAELVTLLVRKKILTEGEGAKLLPKIFS